GDEAAVPIEFSFDFRSRKAGRQRAAGHHMLWANPVGGVVEVDEVAVAGVHSANTEVRCSGIYQVEIHQAFERGFDWRSIVIAHVCGAAVRIKVGRWLTEFEETGRAEKQDEK